MKKRLLMAAIAALTTLGAFAQNYYYVTTTGTSAPYDYNVATGTTTVLGIPSNQVLSPTQTIPFSWSFYGIPYTQYKVSDNGYITFDISATTSYHQTSAFPNPTGANNAIYAFWADWTVATGTGSPDVVRTWTYGTAPNRVHVIQWYSVTPPSNSGYMYASIRLYEGKEFDIVLDYASTPGTGRVGVENVSGTVGVNAGVLVNHTATDPANTDDIVYSFNYVDPMPTYDAGVTSLNLVTHQAVGANITIAGMLANYGSVTMNSFDLNYSVDGGATVTMNKTGVNIAPNGNVYGFSHTTAYVPSSVGVKSIKVWTSNINGNPDQNTVNDDKTGSVNVLSQIGTRKLLLEGFSSSTCPPCKPGNENVHNILAGKDISQYTSIKYQEYFPGNGDPYTTSESIARLSYYGITGIPALDLDGGWNGNSNVFTEAMFDDYLNKPALLDITATHVINFPNVSVNVTINPYTNIPAGAKLHIAIVEGTTTMNVKTNGESEFFNVMKKMVPTASGTTLGAMTANTPMVISTKSYTFPGVYRLPTDAVLNPNAQPTGSNFIGINIANENSVEEGTDLQVVVFVQNNTNKVVYNSNWSTGTNNTAVSRNSANAGLSLYPNPASSSILIDFSLTAKEDVSIEVIDVLGKVVKSEVIGGLAGGDHSIVLNTNELNNGVYYLNLKSNGSVTTEKFVIAK